MSVLLSVVAIAAAGEIYTSYPGLGDEDHNGYNDKRIEVVADKGIVRELIVNCGNGAGILNHDVIDNLFCDAQHRCSGSLQSAIKNTCNP